MDVRWLILIPALAWGQLESAMHKEMVLGDLAGAIADYRAYLSKQDGKPRAAAARAMLHLAECEEKIGDRNAAQRTYMRLSREYADQSEAAQAKEKLFHWMEPVAGPRNLSFEKGEIGKIPPGWFSHAAELTRSGCRSSRCAVVHEASDLTQTFNAAAYRGKTIRLRAWVRVDPEDRARLWVRVERANRQTGFLSERPVRSRAWTLYEISGDVDDDAQSLTFGVMVSETAQAWIDGVSFQAETDSDPETARARAALQRIYQSEGRAELKSVRLSGADAIVTARREDASNVYTLHETWNRIGAGWKMAESKVSGVAPRAVPTSPDEARAVTAELRDLSKPLAVIESGRVYYDLAVDGFAAFGRAVGEARVVATAVPGEMRIELTKYLIAQKGFLSIDADAPDDELARWVRAFNRAKHAAVRFGKPGGEKSIVWTDNDGAARMRGAGVFTIGFMARGEPAMLFLDLRAVDANSALGKWIATPHAFEGDRVEVLEKSYDALIFSDARAIVAENKN